MTTDLVKRLRGDYSVPIQDGAGPLNGSMMFERHFDMPPICGEAADRIEQLEAEVAALNRLKDATSRLFMYLVNHDDEGLIMNAIQMQDVADALGAINHAAIAAQGTIGKS